MAMGWNRMERRVTTSALAAAPLMTVVGTIAMVLSPGKFAESDTATGSGLWIGAIVGLATAMVVYALPQLLFGLALRAGTRRKLIATAVTAPLLAFLSLLPVAGAVIGGWAGVAPLAVVTVGAAGVLDCFVFVVAVRGLRRLGGHHADRTVAPHA
jgi:hypothetical protein